MRPARRTPAVWQCPGCGRQVTEPMELLKGYDGVGHLCPKNHSWQDFAKETRHREP